MIERIRKAKIDIPVDLDSISFYLQKYHKEKNLKPDRVSFLNRFIKSLKVSTIEEFDNILTQQNLSKIDKVLKEGNYSCSYNEIKECLLRYFVALAIHFKVPSDEIELLAKCPLIEDILKKLRK